MHDREGNARQIALVNYCCQLRNTSARNSGLWDLGQLSSHQMIIAQHRTEAISLPKLIKMKRTLCRSLGVYLIIK